MFTGLTERGIDPADIITIGDSAGGNLAIAIAIPLALREQGQPLPGRVIAFSPWLDMENSGETLVTNAATDALITAPLLEGMTAGVLAGGRIDPATPLANPLYADFTAFPRLYVNAGSVECLVDNATRVAERAEAAGVDGTLSIGEGMQHVFPFLAGNAPEADAEIAAIAAWYRAIRTPIRHRLDPRSTPEQLPHPGCRRHPRRSRFRWHLHAAQVSQRTRPDGHGVREGRRRRRHLVLCPTPEGFVYRYSFDEDLLREWDWSTRYLEQRDVLAYLEHVVERFDLARDIQLNTGVTGAVFDESDELWTVTTSTGVTLTARYLVNALGLLAKSNISDIAGRDSVAGTLVHTNAWPKDLDIAGKRVGVIGTGSTGTQFIVAAAKTAGYLSVFQRSPQYWVPSGNGPMDKSEVEPIMADFDNVWDQVRNSVVAFGFEESTVGHERVRRGTAQGVPGCLGQGQRVPVHVRHVLRHRDQPGSQCGRRGVPPLEDRRDRRGPGDRAQAHADRSLRQAAAVQRGVLRDLQPGQSRVGLHQGEPDHRDHPGGVRTADGIEHELDILVFATGFDAVGGNYRAMDLRGRGGRHINEHWAGGPTSYLGVSPAGFPNMFMILGPNGPFTNLPPSIATQVDWIGELIATAERTGVRTVEPAREAEDQWTATCAEIADTGYAGFELARAGETATV